MLHPDPIHAAICLDGKPMPPNVAELFERVSRLPTWRANLARVERKIIQLAGLTGTQVRDVREFVSRLHRSTTLSIDEILDREIEKAAYGRVDT